MKKLTKAERQKRVIARGKFSNHSHVVVGDDVIVEDFGDRVIITVGEDSNASLRHLMEKEFVDTGNQVWTGEHADIKLDPGCYEYVQQQVFDPLTQRIESARD